MLVPLILSLDSLIGDVSTFLYRYFPFSLFSVKIFLAV